MYKSLLSIVILSFFINSSYANDNLFDIGLNEAYSNLGERGQKITDWSYKLKSDNNPLGFKKYNVDVTPVSKTIYQITASKKTVDCPNEINSMTESIKIYYGQNLEMLKKGDSIIYQNSNYIIKTECNKNFLQIRIVSKAAAKLFNSEYATIKVTLPVKKSEYDISNKGAFGILFSDNIMDKKFKYAKDNIYIYEPVKLYGIFMSYYVEKDEKTNNISKIIAGTVIKNAVISLGLNPTQLCDYALDSIRNDIVENIGGIANEIEIEGIHSLDFNTGNIEIICQENKLVFVYKKK